ncbi:MAG: DUF4145 domain-containing protein [Actinobacteria bacterium]|nr:DUF4145 domain-containing protein [Actinomycetota bacterium]
MECPHCRVDVQLKPHVFALGEDTDGTWQVSSARCPACDRLIVDIGIKDGCSYPVWPGSCRPRLSDDIPRDLEVEYRTAARVLPDSPEASAAISRRLLQRFLAKHMEAGGGGLAEQIRRAAASEQTPSYLGEALLTLGRVARLETEGHKSLHPEALIEVEPGEPEWLLDVLQSLFEFHFVQPAHTRRKLEALRERIGAADPPIEVAPAAAPKPDSRPESESVNHIPTDPEPGSDPITNISR